MYIFICVCVCSYICVYMYIETYIYTYMTYGCKTWKLTKQTKLTQNSSKGHGEGDVRNKTKR